MERDLREHMDKVDAAEAENLESVYLYDKAYEEGFADGYKQAVDEFSERLKNHLNQFDFWKYGITDGTNCEMRNYDYMIDEIAEKLKGGVDNGKN